MAEINFQTNSNIHRNALSDLTTVLYSGTEPVIFFRVVWPVSITGTPCVTSSWGRGMTWTAVTVPMRLAAAAPASTARLYRSYFSADDRRDKPGVNFFIADKPDIRSFDHRVRGLDHRDQAHTFDHSKCFHNVLWRLTLLSLFETIGQYQRRQKGHADKDREKENGYRYHT